MSKERLSSVRTKYTPATTTNWLKSGHANAKKRPVQVGIGGHPAGSMGEAEWDDYVQIKFFDQAAGKWQRTTFELESAKVILQQLSVKIKQIEIANLKAELQREKNLPKNGSSAFDRMGFQSSINSIEAQIKENEQQLDELIQTQ